jgi:putative flippase GtrA
MASSSARSFQKSLGVGALASLADLLALVVLVDGLALDPTLANVPALLLGALIQFVGNKWFAFEDRSRAYVRQGAEFAAVELGALALNALAFHALVTLVHAPYGLARILGSALVYLGFSYPLWRRIFRGDGTIRA